MHHPSSDQPSGPHSATLFGHPVGLYTLFFAEMWERFSFYGMRALLIFYMTKAFLKFDDAHAYSIYAAYGALVYAAPFIGGILADRILGPRRAVVLGGSLMAAGHLLMTVEQTWAFYGALSLLILGNGFFKPNISTIVGSLYPEGSPKRDGGFTLFYMGINLGAAIAPLVCGYVGETYGWHYGFGLATIGMMIGLAVFVMPNFVTQLMIMGGAIACSIGLFIWSDNRYQFAVNAFSAVALLIAAVVATVALARGGLPKEAGLPRDPEAAARPLGGMLRTDLAIYLGVLIAIPIIAFLVQRSDIAKVLVNVVAAIAFLYLCYQAFSSQKVERERLFVVLIMMFFSMLFWAFFEQAGSSISNFTDRNVDRVVEEERVITQADVGQTLQVKPNQELVGYPDGRAGKTAIFTITDLEALHEELKKSGQTTFDLTVTEKHVGMHLGGSEVKASMFQAANPIFILIFGLVLTALWDVLGKMGKEPSVPFKFGLGLVQLGLGFIVLWYGANHCDSRGMVAMNFLLLGYLLHTTGELCLSPVGLSMVTRLSPARIVSTVMGAWFLATALSHILAGVIARLTAVTGGEGEGATAIPPPLETVHVYGDVFGKVGVTAIISGLICLALVPFLKKWIHADVIHVPEVSEPMGPPVGLTPVHED